ncbi:hypothetical protein A2454_06740 [Candidatus Peribacteria bacterium RIFOXYC2_FULL_55_14]|nr:MAG: hypothetical protein UY85_C0028G0015 [Candidatus Peribacteria bacterium GW2011_GWB1_54_5]KKW43096.1 MAG: hypothetical protein UY90_C0031G0014 [Candidatus Peregrinibacteria bacterium GW2011_GWA2_54_9]OGJ74126.1 MAG: hypothetical protein A2217_00590 [Candidatus Peribacteria bacterium RIFOXYA2_FULL_55_28]OGJ75557.1 MAG: hypothetical protein A2384_01550 [Candidatus Peribacteria bacterium RIFOXYB1_FULL_54_35]OGJ78872.1 MAG: hypothetical protein A2424_06115 [Candidatus Peribacteria bacterium 
MMYAASVEHIRSLLPKVLRKRGLTEHANAALVIFKAREWIAGHLQDFENDLHPQKFRDGVLTIACVHSIASQECQQRSEDLLSFLRVVCEGIVVEQIRMIRMERKA